jgi:N-acetylglutamate synthase-like GNAT family acetyltransferase
MATMLATECVFRRARASDALAIVHLVNAANSGDGGTLGWTHEANFFEGSRTDVAEVLELLAVPGSTFVLRLEGEEIVGCAYLKTVRSAAYMGLLAVRPMLQAGGIGTGLIAECERIARGEWQCPTILISVITSHRPELTAFYERRGFARTGRFKAFERRQARKGTKVPGLVLEWMEKELSGDHV